MKKIEYPGIARELLRMETRDQAMRLKNLSDPSYWLEGLDREHTQEMESIVSRIGWPTISKVGRTGAKAAWILVQHADHAVEFQKYCLKLMRDASPGEVELRDIAYLEDRVRVNSALPQLYGTQFHDRPDGIMEPRPIEYVGSVDERRKEMGLCSLEEGVQQHRRKYRQKNKQPN
ncbi:MAG TPA: DUF6624 domain-containing protein [Candidatus Paceibacterota bacterium]